MGHRKSKTQTLDQKYRSKVKKNSNSGPGTWMDIQPLPTGLPKSVSRLWKNNHYTVIAHNEVPHRKGGTFTKVQVDRNDGRMLTNHYHAMQKIKNQLFGASTIAWEMHPQETGKPIRTYWLYIFEDEDMPYELFKGSTRKGREIFTDLTINLKKWADIHQGKQALILGGGPSMVKDIKRILPTLRDDHIIIAVNHHAFDFLEIDEADYVVALDQPQHMQNLGVDPLILMHHPKRITTRTGYDEAITYFDGYSGTIAPQIALHLGCEEVFLCGYDLSGGYYYNRAHQPWQKQQITHGLDNWRKAAKKIPLAHQIKSISGPLTDVFDEWRHPSWIKNTALWRFFS